MKDEIKNIIDGTIKFEKDDQIPLFLDAVKQYITVMERTVNPNETQNFNYSQELKKLEEICYTKPKKRKKLPYDFDEIKGRIYKPFNSVLEKNQYTEAEIIELAKGTFEEVNLSINQEWKDLLNKYWIHY